MILLQVLISNMKIITSLGFLFKLEKILRAVPGME